MGLGVSPDDLENAGDHHHFSFLRLCSPSGLGDSWDLSPPVAKQSLAA